MFRLDDPTQKARTGDDSEVFDDGVHAVALDGTEMLEGPLAEGGQYMSIKCLPGRLQSKSWTSTVKQCAIIRP